MASNADRVYQKERAMKKAKSSRQPTKRVAAVKKKSASKVSSRKVSSRKAKRG
jgi:hypothetical protein